MKKKRFGILFINPQKTWFLSREAIAEFELERNKKILPDLYMPQLGMTQCQQ